MPARFPPIPLRVLLPRNHSRSSGDERSLSGSISTHDDHCNERSGPMTVDVAVDHLIAIVVLRNVRGITNSQTDLRRKLQHTSAKFDQIKSGMFIA